MKNIIFIGIDPAFRKDGFAVAVLDTENYLRFKVSKNGFIDFIGWAIHDCPDNAIIGIENSNLDKSLYKKYNNSIGAAMSVGKNQAASQFTVDFCKCLLGDDKVIEVTPKQKGKKVGHEIFSLIIKTDGCKMDETYKGLKGEQDKRDAYAVLKTARYFYRINRHKK